MPDFGKVLRLARADARRPRWPRECPARRDRAGGDSTPIAAEVRSSGNAAADIVRSVSTAPLIGRCTLDASSAVVRSVVELTMRLVKIPSRAEIDDPGPMFAELDAWLEAHGLTTEMVRSASGEPVALASRVSAPVEGPIYVLNAPVDTAPFGDESAWSRPPLSGEVADGWLHGRGAADCKSGAAIFCHVLAGLRPATGTVVALFDADEHSGGFSGVRTFFDTERAAGVYIGYPGNEEIITGSRGFLRAHVRVYGRAAHSGSRSKFGLNAVSRAAVLIGRLSALRFQAAGDVVFPVPPKITVTGVRGGESFSMVPDTCTVDVDIRTTPSFDQDDARALLTSVVTQFDAEDADRGCEIEFIDGWPSYKLADDEPLVDALVSSATLALGARPRLAIAGPSNIGNYLAGIGVPATAGFGVAYRNLHAVDEAIEIASIGPVHEAYCSALERLLGSPQ